MTPATSFLRGRAENAGDVARARGTRPERVKVLEHEKEHEGDALPDRIEQSVVLRQRDSGVLGDEVHERGRRPHVRLHRAAREAAEEELQPVARHVEVVPRIREIGKDERGETDHAAAGAEDAEDLVHTLCGSGTCSRMVSTTTRATDSDRIGVRSASATKSTLANGNRSTLMISGERRRLPDPSSTTISSGLTSRRNSRT